MFRENIRTEISESQQMNIVDKTRAEQSLRSVLSDFENLEYWSNIFKKHEIDILVCSIQRKELQQIKFVFIFN